MKIFCLLLCLLAPELAYCQTVLPPIPPPLGTPISSLDIPPTPPTSATPAPTPSVPPTHNFRVEVLIVDLPEEKALALLPDLRDDAKIEGAYKQIIEAIQHKEVRLVGYPVVFTPNDERASSETTNEIIYPTEFEPPKVDHGNETTQSQGTTITTTDNHPPPFNLTGAPTRFEKRNATVDLEVNVTLPLPDKRWFKVDFEVQNVVFLGYTWFEVLKMPTLTSSIQQPEFYAMKVNSSLVLRSGQRVLCGMHKLKNPAGQVELFIMQATATPVGG